MIDSEPPVYKLCKRGHVRSPENVGTSGACAICRRLLSQLPDKKAKVKAYRQDPEHKKAHAEYEKKRRKKPEAIAYMAEYEKRPERIAAKKKLRESEYWIEWHKQHRLLPHVRAAEKIRCSSEHHKAVAKIYNASGPRREAIKLRSETPSVKEWIYNYRRSPAYKQMCRDRYRTEAAQLYRRKREEELPDGHVAGRLGLRIAGAPKELLEIKRLTIQLSRRLRQ